MTLLVLVCSTVSVTVVVPCVPVTSSRLYVRVVGGSWTVIVMLVSAALVRLERTIVGRVKGEVWVRVVSIEREMVLPLVEGIEVVKWFGIRVRFKGCTW